MIRSKKRVFVYPYKAGSESAKAIAEGLGAKRIKLIGSRYVRKPGDIIINWGSSDTALITVNNDDNVAIVSNKLHFFQSLVEGSPVPDYTTDRSVASQWIVEGHSVCCRTILNGHSGNGLVLADTEEQLVNAPLYTKYVKKKDEYRIHCFSNPKNNWQTEVFHVQRKAKRREVESPNWRIRNHSNGFVFVMGDVNPPACVLEAAKNVFSQTGLDFGAVDVGYNEREDRAVVYEVNTAPGVEGTTLQKYVEMLRNFL